MTEKKSKPTTQKKVLDVQVTEIFVAHNAKRRAYIEQFSFSSVNFTQKHLGTLCGFFLIRDKSPWSAHIVNFLTAEIKKEYFGIAKRNIVNSFEAALHRGNRALAELVKSDSVDWLGTLDGVVCAFDKENIHFSVTGNGIILLLRDDELIDIGQGLASDLAPENPLKTFVDTANGRLLAGDKIIITSQELLTHVPFEQLQKNARNFSRDAFPQFVSTVLTNECDIATTIIIDVLEKTIRVVPRTAVSELDDDGDDDAVVDLPKNAFGADAFVETEPGEDPLLEEVDEKVDEMVHDENGEYVDKRTGHIYVKDEDGLPEQNAFSPFINQTKDFLSDASYATKKRTGKIHRRAIAVIIDLPEILLVLIKRIAPRTGTPTLPPEFPINDSQEKSLPAISEPAVQSFTDADPTHNEPSLYRKMRDQSKKTPAPHPASIAVTDENESQSYTDRARNVVRTAVRYIGAGSGYFWDAIVETAKKIFRRGATTIKTRVTARHENSTATHSSDAPSYFRRLSGYWRDMTTKTKLTALGIIAGIIIVPILWQSLRTPSDTSTTPQADIVIDTGVGEPEITPIVQSAAAIVSEEADSIGVFKIDTGILVAHDQELTQIDDSQTTQKVALPSDSGSLVHATYMEDLKFLFFITDSDKLYSYSPLTGEFTPQTITPAIASADVEALSAYTSYLIYTHENKVTRYTRTSDGFDQPRERLDSAQDLSDLSSQSVDGSIYIVNDKKLLIIEGGVVVDRTLPGGITPTLVFAANGGTFVWVMDTSSKTLYAMNKETLTEEKRIDDPLFEDATALVVDEANNTVYFTTSADTRKISY